jgi:hypothetical protein
MPSDGVFSREDMQDRRHADKPRKHRREALFFVEMEKIPRIRTAFPIWGLRQNAEFKGKECA